MNPRFLVLVCLTLFPLFASAQPHYDPTTICKVKGLDFALIADDLEDNQTPQLRATVEESLVVLLRYPDLPCQTRAAILLGRIHPLRATPALPLIRKALEEEGPIRLAAAYTIVAMGTAAVDAASDLEAAAAKDPDIKTASESFQGTVVRLEECLSPDLQLVATTTQPKRAYFTCHGRVFETETGAALLNGRIVSFDAESATVQAETVAKDFSMQKQNLHMGMFGAGALPKIPVTAEHTGNPINIHFDGDVSTFATLLARAFGLNVTVESGTTGNVKVTARSTAWDAVMPYALENSGFGYKLDRDAILRIARADKIGTLRPLSTAKPTGSPITFQFTKADLEDVIRFLQEILSKKIELPAGPYDPVTMFVTDLPADEILDLLLVSRGWKYSAKGNQISVVK